jgi:hypothetical protein
MSLNGILRVAVTMGREATSIITTKLVRAGLSPRAVCCGLAFVGMCIMPALYGQQDIHASLTPPAGRKSAPAFELVTQDGKKMHISDFRGKGRSAQLLGN